MRLEKLPPKQGRPGKVTPIGLGRILKEGAKGYTEGLTAFEPNNTRAGNSARVIGTINPRTEDSIGVELEAFSEQPEKITDEEIRTAPEVSNRVFGSRIIEDRAKAEQVKKEETEALAKEEERKRLEQKERERVEERSRVMSQGEARLAGKTRKQEERAERAKTLEYQELEKKQAETLKGMAKGSEGMERGRPVTPNNDRKYLDDTPVANWGQRFFEEDLEYESDENEWTEADELRLDLMKMLARLEDLKDKLEKTNRLRFFQRQKYKKEIEMLEGRDGQGGAIEEVLYQERKKRAEIEKIRHSTMLEKKL